MEKIIDNLQKAAQTGTIRILVVDDNQKNLEVAKAQFANHNLTVVDNYDEAQTILSKPHDFAVVLADLLMPPGNKMTCPSNGTEAPVGIYLALLAAKNGAKYVAVFTDSDHHSSPASACFDAFNNNNECAPIPFPVGTAQVMLSNTRNWMGDFIQEDMVNDDYWRKEGSFRGKNWQKVLDYLLNYSS